jgi:hypothetical protein
MTSFCLDINIKLRIFDPVEIFTTILSYAIFMKFYLVQIDYII